MFLRKDGAKSFSLTVDGTVSSLSIDVDASDPTLFVFDAIAAVFNVAASSGVYAEVVSDSPPV